MQKKNEDGTLLQLEIKLEYVPFCIWCTINVFYLTHITFNN